jgi:hypothetical protein
MNDFAMAQGLPYYDRLLPLSSPEVRRETTDEPDILLDFSIGNVAGTCGSRA